MHLLLLVWFEAFKKIAIHFKVRYFFYPNLSLGLILQSGLWPEEAKFFPPLFCAGAKSHSHLHVQQFTPENWANTELPSTIFTELLHTTEFSSTTVFLYAPKNLYTTEFTSTTKFMYTSWDPWNSVLQPNNIREPSQIRFALKGGQVVRKMLNLLHKKCKLWGLCTWSNAKKCKHNL